MIEQQKHDDLEFQCLLTQEIGDLLPAALTREYDLSRAHAVLEIGCGPGYWLGAMARAYPHLSCILRTEVIEEKEHAALCDQLETELTNQDFCGLSFLLLVWAPHP